MSDAATTNLEPKRRVFPCGCVSGFFGLGILLLLFGAALGPIGPGNGRLPESSAMQAARSIDLLLFTYSNDNDGEYPAGKSSTEIFQKLLDGGYANDPAIFYLPLPGKIRPVSGQKLMPENVGFDVTLGLERSSPDELPMVFMTGYKVAYMPGGAAVPITNLDSQNIFSSRTWSQWWSDEKPLRPQSGMAVAYKSNSAMFLKLITTSENPAGSVPNFISPNYKPDGKTYRQLTPDGPLP